jgi:MFS family permease
MRRHNKAGLLVVDCEPLIQIRPSPFFSTIVEFRNCSNVRCEDILKLMNGPTSAQQGIIAASASVTFGFIRGIHSSFGVFFVALLETFGWSRGVTAGVFSVSLVVDAILSPIVGKLIDRFGPRVVVAAGGILMAGGFFLCSQVNSLWQLYFYFGFVAALGFSAMGMVPHVVLVSEWFSSRRGLGLGVVYGAVGVGILMLVPLIQRLISLWGWPRAFQILAAVVLFFFVPLVWATYRRGPFHQGGSRLAANESESEWSVKLALRSLQF